MPENVARYSSFAIVLHWLMALALLALVGLGFYMTGMPMSPLKLKVFSWHKWAGITLLVLVLVRMVWRLVAPAPALPGGMSRLMKLAAHGGHLALYGLMLAIPLSGWLMSSAKGFQTVWFGVLPLPDLIGKNLELGKALSGVHWTLNVALLVIVAGHVLAALMHQFVQKDGTLYRMVPAERLRVPACPLNE